FVDRVDELDRLVGDLAAGQKVFLISPRRYGKSSLIRHALSALARRGALTTEVTVSRFSSYVAFLEGYAQALAVTEMKWDRARHWLRDAIRAARIEVRAASDDSAAASRGGLSVSFPGALSAREVSRLAQDVFALPERLADACRKSVVVALDEFQAIAGFDGEAGEHGRRAPVAPQPRGGRRLAGAAPHLALPVVSP